MTKRAANAITIKASGPHQLLTVITLHLVEYMLAASGLLATSDFQNETLARR